jgi:predicted double-glycine peptidase
MLLQTAKRLDHQSHRGKLFIKLVCGWFSLLAVSLAMPALCVSAAEIGKKRFVRSILEIRQDKVVVQQWDISCGAAALATILTYQYGDPVPEKKIVQAMLKRTDPLRVKFRGGFSLLDLKRFAESRGYSADGYTEVSLENLIEFGPSIVPVNISGYDHFVVFRGIVADNVLLADPAFGNRTLSIERFQHSWLQNMAFVVRRGDGSTGRNQLAPEPNHFVAPPGIAIRTAIRSGADG